MEKLRFIPIGLLLAFVGKIGYLGASLPDAFVVFTLALLTAYFELLPSQKELKEIKEELKTHKLELERLHRANEDIKTSVTGIKIGSQMQRVNTR